MTQFLNISFTQMFSYQVKISGDGAAISHSSNLVVCSFSLLTEDANVMSSSGRVGSWKS